MNVAFKRLSDVSSADIIALMTDPRMRKHMPLLGAAFDDSACRAFVEAKERAWEEFGYGVWAFMLDGHFAGWGGIQDENGDPDLALVLHPDYWGSGRAIYDAVLEKAFNEIGFTYVTVLLPPTRKNLAALERLGFERDGSTTIEGSEFIRFRLTRDKFRNEESETSS